MKPVSPSRKSAPLPAPRRRVLAAVLGVSLVAALTMQAGRAREDDLARELPRIRAKTPAEAIAGFKLHDGFHLKTAATEPIVTDPVSACYDADGRLFVVEMRGYPYPENSPTGNVRLLEDVDGDGAFEKSTIFLDGLSWPTSVVPSEGGVFLAVPPEILYAKDTNGDGVADLRKVMFRGFGTQNVQGLVNGLIWGPDGWIYGTSSSNGGDITNLIHPERKPVSVRGQDFRFRPDGSDFEAISGGGQFGHTFDDWGHRFTCNNSNHIRQIVLEPQSLRRNPALAVPSVVADIAVEGPAAPVFRISEPEPWRVVRTRQRVADPAMLAKLAPTERFAAGFFTSATGVTVYRGSAFPPEYRGNAFVGDVGANLVHRKRLTANGAIYEAMRADRDVEFLASPDNWFRPVNFANTPQGTLLLLDMYRETIEHPFSIPEPIKKHLDLTSGRDKGRIYEIVPDGFVRRAKPALSLATTVELVNHLADPDAWWRETAQRILLERKDLSAVTLLRAKISPESCPLPQGRAHALWTLSALGELAEGDLSLGLRDPSPRVREQALALASDRKDRSRELDLAIAGLASDADSLVRFRVALAIRDDTHGDASRPLADILRRDAGDPWMRLAAYSSLDQVRAAKLLGRLCLDVPEGISPAPPGLADELAELVGAGGRSPTVESLLTRVSEDSVDRQVMRAVIRGLGRGLQRSGGSLREVVAGSPRPDVADRVFLRAARDASGDGDVSARVEATQIVGLGAIGLALEVLPALLDGRRPAEVQLAALRALGELPDASVGRVVIEHWKALSPSVRREAAEVLFARADRVVALLDAIEAKELASGELEAGRQKALLNHPDGAIRQRAARLLAGSPQSDRAQVIAAFKPALLLEGKPDAGRSLFQKTCATCHKAEGQGENLGPDLATVSGRTAEDLLVHILDPNREVLPQYLDYSVGTDDGRVFTGMIANESANSVTLKRAGGVTDVIPRDRIETIASTGVSLMPEGLEKGLSAQDLADLVGFLRSIRPPSSRSK